MSVMATAEAQENLLRFEKFSLAVRCQRLFGRPFLSMKSSSQGD